RSTVLLSTSVEDKNGPSTSSGRTEFGGRLRETSDLQRRRPFAFDRRPCADRLAGRPRAVEPARRARAGEAAFAPAISWLVCRAVAVRARRAVPRDLVVGVAGADHEPGPDERSSADSARVRLRARRDPVRRAQ